MKNGRLMAETFMSNNGKTPDCHYSDMDQPIENNSNRQRSINGRAHLWQWVFCHEYKYLKILKNQAKIFMAETAPLKGGINNCHYSPRRGLGSVKVII